jgi:hypothetical protein
LIVSLTASGTIFDKFLLRQHPPFMPFLARKVMLAFRNLINPALQRVKRNYANMTLRCLPRV